MSERVNLGGFMASLITFSFLFSTIYTLAFFYSQATGQLNPGQIAIGGGSPSVEAPLVDVFGIFDSILNIISWLSPFAAIKFLMVALVENNAPILYQVIDLLILRPIGWIVTALEINYLVSKIPTISQEG